MAGFGAFRDPTCIDFAETDLFALQGPTGAGKSTVIDAICFALFGNVPRYDDQRLVGAAMTTNAAEMRVRLRFEVAGRMYEAVRVVRRTTGTAPGSSRVSTKEARLEVVDGPVLAGKEGELRTAMEELLGLTFDDFTRCVVLPQGAFARFLHDKPADRQALLVRLLDLGVYGRMLQRANARVVEIDREMAFIDGRLDGLAEATPANLAEVGAALARVRTAEAALITGFPRLAAAEDAARAAGLAFEEQSRWLAAIGNVAVPAGVAELAERFAAGRRSVDELEARHRAAVSGADRSQAALADGPEPAAIAAALQVYERLAKGREVVARIAEEIAEARQAAAAAASQAATAATAADAARDALARLRSAHLAHTLAVELQPGEPCPVCEQVVSRLPLPTSPTGLAEVERRARAAEQDADALRREADTAAHRVAVLADRAARADDLLAELSAELDGAPTREVLLARQAEANGLAERARLARLDEQAARAAVAEARNRLEQLHQEEQQIEGRMHAQRDELVALGPPAPTGTVAEAWAALASWAAGRRPGIQAHADELSARRTDALSRVEGERRALVELVQAAGVGVPSTSSPDHLGRAVDRELHSLTEREAAIRLSIEQRDALLERRGELDGRRIVAGELGRLLKADRFQRWLVEETLVDLAAGASGRLFAMSAGRYSLDLGAAGEFTVVDHAEGDERRGVRTLSGGETFQASLALALALSDHLVEMSGRRGHMLESIFLDEGFGTLDSESLDAVATTIERLGSHGRMVGIVTHVAALAERMPVRFVVSRGPRSAVVERVGS